MAGFIIWLNTYFLKIVQWICSTKTYERGIEKEAEKRPERSRGGAVRKMMREGKIRREDVCTQKRKHPDEFEKQRVDTERSVREGLVCS